MLRDKGVIEFVTAARELRAEGAKARFVLCGEPDALNPSSLTEKEIKAFVEEGAVEYWGWQEDMGAVWREADIVCLPSYREGLPKALLEAAATGLPVVATDVPGCREIARPGVNGWLVPARDSRALAAALREAIAREDLRGLYGKRGREIVEMEFSLAYVIEQTLKVYDELLRSEPSAAPN
jgi:glycosyltransferase involved in cell wall biosynthesis